MTRNLYSFQHDRHSWIWMLSCVFSDLLCLLQRVLFDVSVFVETICELFCEVPVFCELLPTSYRVFYRQLLFVDA
jgi:hypothetical protein